MKEMEENKTGVIKFSREKEKWKKKNRSIGISSGVVGGRSD